MYLTATVWSQLLTDAYANTPPSETTFAIAFLALPDGQSNAGRKQWAWTTPELATGAPKSEGLGPFLTQADLTSIKLTINANKNISQIPGVSAADKDFIEVFSVLRRTSKLDILAVGPPPNAKNAGWRYIFGRSDNPIVLKETDANPEGRAQPWQAVLKILSDRGYNALALPIGKGQVVLVTANPKTQPGAQVAIFKETRLQKAGNALAGIVELRETKGPAQFLGEVLVAESPDWQPRPWTPAYIETQTTPQPR